MTHNENDHSRLKMTLAEIMTGNIVTIAPSDTITTAAVLMKEHNVGSVVLQGSTEGKNPLGILTERDIVTRVVALRKNPEKISANEVATKPVITAPPSMEITKAMELMARMNIRRLIIVEKNLCVGIVTYRDLLRVAPSLLEIALEYERIGFGANFSQNPIDYQEDDEEEFSAENKPLELSLGFYCSSCGEFCNSSPIYDADDQPLCPDCYNESYK